jgi:tight adherence protein B
MEIESAWIVIASICAACVGCFGMRALLVEAQKGDRVVQIVGGNKKDRFINKLYVASRPFEPIAVKLLHIEVLSSVCRSANLVFGKTGLSTIASKNLALLLFVSTCAGILGILVSRSVVFGLAAACIVFGSVVSFVKSKLEKINTAMREQVPEAIRCIGSCFGSGYSLLQTMNNTAEEVGGNLGKVFSQCAKRLEMGESSKESLSVLADVEKVPELVFVSVALDVQHRCGGSISGILDSARDSVESELELARNLKVQTAQARLSSSIVTWMPFILVAIFSFVSPGFLSPFFESLAGIALLVVALLMQAAGVFSVRHMLKVEV